MFNSSFKFLFLGILACSSSVWADDATTTNMTTNDVSSPDISQDEDIYSLNALKKIHLRQLKIDAKANQPENIKDPLQALNRKTYAFNNVLDQNIVRPIAVGYEKDIPEDIRLSYGNFRSNLREPWNAFNQIIQGHPVVAAKTLGRFSINTLTSLGFADTAKRIKLINQREDFGATLGVWGVKSGPYLVLPFLGPSTFRDTIGTVVDRLATPKRQLFNDDKIYWSNTALEGIDSRAQFLSMDSILQGDKYSALRDAYLQQRSFFIASKRGEDVSDAMFSEDSFTEDEPIDDQSDSSAEKNTTPKDN